MHPSNETPAPSGPVTERIRVMIEQYRDPMPLSIADMRGMSALQLKVTVDQARRDLADLAGIGGKDAAMTRAYLKRMLIKAEQVDPSLIPAVVEPQAPEAPPATSPRQRLILAQGDGTEVFRRARDRDATALITFARSDGARAGNDDPGVRVRVRPDGYYVVIEQHVGSANDRVVARRDPDGYDAAMQRCGGATERVIARGHLNPQVWTEAELNYIHAGECPKPFVKPGQQFLQHCGKRVDEAHPGAPFCPEHAEHAEPAPPKRSGPRIGSVPAAQLGNDWRATTHLPKDAS